MWDRLSRLLSTIQKFLLSLIQDPRSIHPSLSGCIRLQRSRRVLQFTYLGALLDVRWRCWNWGDICSGKAIILAHACSPFNSNNHVLAYSTVLLHIYVPLDVRIASYMVNAHPNLGCWRQPQHQVQQGRLYRRIHILSLAYRVHPHLHLLRRLLVGAWIIVDGHHTDLCGVPNRGGPNNICQTFIQAHSPQVALGILSPGL